MIRPAPYLIEECDADVIDYIGGLELQARYHQQELDSLLARLRELEAERDALQQKTERLWEVIAVTMAEEIRGGKK